jgi:hypothetical protein
MRRTLLVLVALGLLALPLSGSQFIKLPFDKIVQESTFVVRGTIGPVNAAWNGDREIIFTSANLEISEYLVGTGPQVLRIREVGGTVDGYTQQAIGFPELREGEEVVLMLTRWDDSGDYRIHAYAQGKYVVEGKRVRLDAGQGEMRPDASTAKSAADEGMSLDEFRTMVDAADRGRPRVRE